MAKLCNLTDNKKIHPTNFMLSNFLMVLDRGKLHSKKETKLEKMEKVTNNVAMLLDDGEAKGKVVVNKLWVQCNKVYKALSKQLTAFNRSAENWIACMIDLHTSI